jgi:hypothetical protein
LDDAAIPWRDVNTTAYTMTIGRDLIAHIQLNVQGNNLSIKWNYAVIPWRDVDTTVNDIYLAQDRHSYQSIEQHEQLQPKTNILLLNTKSRSLRDCL